MVTHEDWVAELDRLQPGNHNHKADGWFTFTEIMELWGTKRTTTQNLLYQLRKENRVDVEHSYRVDNMDRSQRVAVYRLKEPPNEQ